MLLVLSPLVAGLVSPYQALLDAKVIRAGNSKTLVAVVPQLGEFDSAEYAEHLTAVEEDLLAAGITLCMVGIGDSKAADTFSAFTGFDRSKLHVQESAELHRALELHEGPQWTAPDFVPDSVLSFLLSSLPGGVPEDGALLRPHFNAWLNYMAMCAGLSAPGTLPEIARGYLGDRSAPERLRPDEVVKVKDVIEIGPGVGPVRLGPFRYTQGWADEAGYQRPIELATVRLKNMVEVLEHWGEYVSDPRHIAVRGATYLFDESGAELYSYRSRGVLTYSRTMARPLSFLAPFIGATALNPLGLGDASIADAEAGTA